ncbi:MAG: glycosyltransferase [Thermodesulfobacteriota bacterium]|nr:glycosyltransferase [Thermodesulfobacteriota bacterium]
MCKYAVIFIGGSVENTPKVARVYGSLVKHFNHVKLFTLSKHGHGVGDSYSYDAGANYMKFIKYLFFSFLILFHLAKKRPTRVYAINPFAGVIALIYTFIFRKQYYYESLEIFTGSSSSLYSNKWFRPLFYRIERTIACRARYFITPDQYRMRFLRRYYRIPAEKCFFLYNTRIFSEVLPSKTQSGYAQPIVSYCGLLMPGRGIEEIIKAFASFEVGGTLWLVGDWGSGLYRTKLQSLVEGCGIADRVVFRGKVSNSEMLSYMQESDITFALYKRNCVNNRLCSPNKFFDSMASGVKLITVNCYLADFLRNNGALIYTVKEVSVQEIVTAFQFCHSAVFNSGVTEILSSKFDWLSEEKKLVSLLSAD